MDKPKIIIICGATGLGKTAVAVELSQIFHAEIVGADSMQIYRHMDIGTAKPTAEEQARVRHHMIDIVDPDEPFDAARYAKMARSTIAQMQEKGIIPFVVGGTGFYIRALAHGLFESPPADPHIRKRLQEEADAVGVSILHDRLKTLDPDASVRIHPNDTYRILRALEVREATGKTISTFHQSHEFSDQPFDVLMIGLHMERGALYSRIDRRVDLMIDDGLPAEVEALLEKGYSADLKSMQSIGYRHMVDFTRGHLNWDEAVRTLKRDTRRYAKRQLTWFSRDPAIRWTDPENTAEMGRQIEAFLQDTSI